MNKSHWLAIVILLVALSLLVGQVAAAPPQVEGLAEGDDFLVSRAEAAGRGNSAVAYNDDLDEYLVVWVDGRAGGVYWDLYGQIVTSHGTPQGDNFLIRDEASAILNYPDVAYDTNNQRYLVAWYDMTEFDVEGLLLNSDGSAFGSAFNVSEGDSGDIRGYPSATYHPYRNEYLVVFQGGASGDYNIYGRRVDATGTIGATEYGISTAADDQTDPDVSVDPSSGGNFLIVWEDGRSGTVDEIWGTLMYYSWMLGPEFAISTGTTVGQYNPTVAFNPAAGTDGAWLVVFQRDESGDSQIGGWLVAADGDPAATGFYICDDSEDQIYPDVAYNAYGDDQWLVVWEDHRAGSLNYDIYGQRVAVNGSTMGHVLAVYDPPEDQMAPAVASSSANDGYLVVFSDYQTSDIIGRQVIPDGAVRSLVIVVSAPLGEQQQASVAYNSQDGEYLVVWHDQRAGNWDIYGQRVDLDGTLLGYTFAICSDTSAQINPSVAYNLDTNQYLVVWDDRRNDDGDIYGQIVEADGDLSGGNVAIADSGATGRHVPRLTYNPISGEFFVVFGYAAENNNIRGRRLGVNGAPLAAEIDIATGTANQYYPDVACRTLEPGGGDYLVVWRDTDGTLQDIRGQRLSQTGGLLGSLAICTQASSQWSPSVAYSPDDDRYLVVWPDDRDDATQGRNVYGRQVSGAGLLYNDFAISTASENQAVAAVTYGSGPGNYIVAWEDNRNASTAPDLYGQRVSGTGELVDTLAGDNDELYTSSAAQESPAVAWAGDGTQGLLVWADNRNGENYDVYGLCLAASGYRVFLPVVMKDYP
jgi:hypothetical protein